MEGDMENTCGTKMINSEECESGGQDNKKMPMSDEERLKLADKLDNDLEEWLNGLEKKAYKDGWPEDKWEEEMTKHPFFMKEFPENTDDSPLIRGIQMLKYDENENTPLELAQSYKEDGNFNFKHKKYRMAVISYTEGLRRKCGESEMDATLYNNRAAAQFFLGNYRSSLLDCKTCLSLKPLHDKAEARAAQCCLNLKKCREAIAYADSYLKRHPDNVEIKKIVAEARSMQKMIERDRRKDERREKKDEEAMEKLQSALVARGVEVEVNGDPYEVLQGMHEKPQLLLDGSIVWPVFFLYPEYSTSDFIQEFNENDRIISMLQEMFTETPDWDKAGKYKVDDLSVYYEGAERSEMYAVNVKSTLKNVISRKGFVARDWRPAFLVFVKGSTAEHNFLNNYKACNTRSCQEISSRLLLARLAFKKKSKIFEANNIDINIRRRLLKRLVWSLDEN